MAARASGRQGARADGALHDRFLARLAWLEAAGDTAVAHDQDAVAQAQDFRQLRGDHHDRRALLVGEAREKLVDLALGADIDAARRLVDEENAAAGVEGARHHAFLLVAAGELADQRLRVAHADREPPRQLRHALPLAASAQDQAAERSGRPRDRHVEGDILRQETAMRLAVLRQQADAEPDGGARAGEPGFAPMQRKAFGARGIGADDGAEQLRPPRSGEAADAQNLALAHVEIDAVEHAGAGEAADGEDGFSETSQPGRKSVGDAPADHHADQAVMVDLIDRPRSDHRAVAQYGHAMADGEDFLQPVGDVDEGDALGREPPDHLEEFFELRPAERRRRLVEHDDAGIARQRGRDLHHLPLRDAQVHEAGTRIDAEAEPVHHGEAVAVERAPIDDSEAGPGQAAEKNVLGDCQVRRLHELLVDDGDSELDHPERRRALDQLARDPHLAGIRQVGPGEDLHERRLAGAVLAHEAMHFARLEREVDAGQRPHARKAPCDAVHRKERLAGRRARAPENHRHVSLKVPTILLSDNSLRQVVKAAAGAMLRI